MDAKKISLAHNGSRLNSPVRFGDERKYGNNHNHAHHAHHHHHHHHGHGGHQSHHIEVYSDGAGDMDISKLEEEISEDDRGPPLPPRPAPRTRTAQRMETAVKPFSAVTNVCPAHIRQDIIPRHVTGGSCALAV
uniref:Uncharacterized protein n=1 Tax=Anopheles culicifacies TaxID=139723 RepID=A0A182M2Y3_9DIPT